MNDFNAAFTLAEGATHVVLPKGCRRSAFTLAEVLITLGIIGVVAAMTIPTLIQNHQKNLAVSQFKKVYSLLQNAETAAIVDYDTPNTWDYSLDVVSFFERYYFPYLIIDKKFSLKDANYTVKNLSGAQLGTFILPINTHARNVYGLTNGTMIAISKNNQYLFVTVDANGKKGPNVYGKDIWDFELYWLGPKKLVANGILSTDWNRCLNYMPGSGDGCTCGGLLVQNNYIIDENYPWK